MPSPGRLAAFLSIALATITLILALDEEATSQDIPADVSEALEVLWNGDAQSRRAVAEEAYDIFRSSLATAEDDDASAKKVVRYLRDFLRIEHDDWISSRLLRRLPSYTTVDLSSLYLDALRSSSQNLRWRAIQWFAEHENPDALPDLEDIWRHEERLWVRLDLIQALALHGSVKYLDDLVRLSRAEDPELSTAAVRALAMLDDPVVVPHLARIVREGRLPERKAALDALPRWSDSNEAAQAILGASRIAHPDLQVAAAAALKRLSLPAASDRLIEMAATEGDPRVRVAALQALEYTDLSVVLPLFVELLNEPDTGAMSPVHTTVLGILRSLDTPDVVPYLQGLDPRLGSGLNSVGAVVSFLLRDRSQEHPLYGCTRDEDVMIEPEVAVEYRVAPLPGTHSIRCWEFPDVPGDPEEFPRIPAGGMVQIEDHFEREEESWAQVDGDDADECWVPRRYLEPASAVTDDDGVEAGALLRREFDLTATDATSRAAADLAEAGVLEVFEPGDGVVGVALAVDPTDLAQVRALGAAYGSSDSILDEQVLNLARDLARHHGAKR